MSRNRRPRPLRAVRRPAPVADAHQPDPFTDPIDLGDEPIDGFTYLDKVWTHPFHGVGLQLAQERAGEADQ